MKTYNHIKRSMASKLAFLVPILCLFSLTQEKVRIMIPDDLRKTIPTQPGNYGHIPYGFYTRGKLYYDVTLNKSPNYACESLTNLQSAVSSIEYDYYPTFLINQGNCSFVQMTRMAQESGARLAMIISDKYETSAEIKKVELSDDGTANDIFIPTLLITKRDGNIITEYMTTNPNQTVYLELEFPTRQAENVQIDFYLHASDKEAYQFMSEFKDFFLEISSHATFVPHYVIHRFANITEEEKKGNCVSNGQYCVPGYPLVTNKNGRQIILEGLYQYFIYDKIKQYSIRSYFDYVTHFRQNCNPETAFSRKCGHTYLASLNINPEEITKSISTSFGKTQGYENDNMILQRELEDIESHSITQFPLIVINGKKIYGALTAQNIFYIACSSFAQQPQACKDYYRPTTSKGLGWFQITLIVIATLIINIAIIFVCRKYLAQKFSERVENNEVDLNGQINSAISNYFALKEPVNTQLTSV